MHNNVALSLRYLFVLVFLGIATYIFICIKDNSVLRRFRTSNDPFPSNLINPPSSEGLADLHVSGSARITQNALNKALKKALEGFTEPIYVIDLLEEPNFYIKGSPSHWYGYQRRRDIILPTNSPVGIKYLIRRLYRTGKLSHTEQDMQTEKEMVEELGYNYESLSWLRAHRPTPDQIDHLIKVLLAIPPKSWVHFHCSAGRGRTTIAIVMRDILINGKSVSVEDIVKRHHLLGSEDLLNTEAWANGSYTKEMLEERKNLIVKFHQYVNDPQGLGHSSWKEWIKVNG